MLDKTGNGMRDRMRSLSIERAGRADHALLFRLLQLYYFEATRWSGEDIGPDGLYECDPAGVSSYLEADGADAAWILKVDGMVAGFALVEPVPLEGGPVRELADLFVLPRYRRLGLADFAFRRLVLDGGEPCLVAVFRKDEDALRHWRRAFARLPCTVRPGPDDDVFHLFVVQADPGDPPPEPAAIPRPG